MGTGFPGISGGMGGGGGAALNTMGGRQSGPRLAEFVLPETFGA